MYNAKLNINKGNVNVGVCFLIGLHGGDVSRLQQIIRVVKCL